MWLNINMAYATPHPMNCWAYLAGDAWRKVKPISNDGVTNTHLLLALAKANTKKAHVTKDGANQIVAVYL